MGLGQTADFLAGVIEGFYGPPWTPSQRVELFEWMRAWGLNTYLYAPKDDLKHRAIWRQIYAAAEAEKLRETIQVAKRRTVRFIYALSPGLDIDYESQTDQAHLKNRFEQMIALGCRDFALLFDDVPERVEAKSEGSLATAQARLANSLFRWTREQSPSAIFLFCPAAYCGRMAERKLGGEDYLGTLGRELLPEIDVFWTGPEIISREITVAHIEQLRAVLHRKPVIWDNLHANDYDGRRLYCGPCSGRPPELRTAVKGLLSNPNNEFPLNFVPIRTLAKFVHCEGAWDSRGAFLEALAEWLPHFATVGPPIRFEDLRLFADCYYLPHEEGPEAQALYELAKSLVTTREMISRTEAETFRATARRLRDFCVRMTELRDRSLFYALSRRIWDLREELDLLLGFIDWKAQRTDPNERCHSDFHLPGTFRGGMVARLQSLLAQQEDGSIGPTDVGAHSLAARR